MPPTADATKLAPTFTLAQSAKSDPPSGTSRDFSAPQKYTVTAQDGSTQVYKVNVLKSTGDGPTAFAWTSPAAGKWSDGTRWSNNLATGAPPAAAGRPDYLLDFSKTGPNAVTNDLGSDFLLNQQFIEHTIPEKPNSRLQKYRITEAGASWLGSLGIGKTKP